ncbi:MOSC domain-containing protein [Allostreptomyces psammosilenae]|uniref:MOSC domain-containing protein YiiM n=1 Tax=Allostreptomyces psammosilenae TaxID=1892865 RepID=A0A853A600_9ACTN|nr:MOSC domain-containing protein [Allostreptomyces psammosilenae]NYI05958.1 MOSC domain-containing protein YiiM [Allostreptomyces psammosilenae]
MNASPSAAPRPPHADAAPTGRVFSVNVGQARATEHAAVGVTGIDKRPVDGPVRVAAPGPRGTGGSGLVGDAIGDLRHHGGDDQAVYAYAREDLDGWAEELGRELPGGSFGENLTTTGVDVNGARIGERWQIGDELLLEVCGARIPCRTFADKMGVRGWVRRFTQAVLPGAYLRVLRPGEVRAGDAVRIAHRPDHDVTVALVFRAFTTESDLLPRLLVADALPERLKEKARKRLPMELDDVEVVGEPTA